MEISTLRISLRMKKMLMSVMKKVTQNMLQKNAILSIFYPLGNAHIPWSLIWFWWRRQWARWLRHRWWLPPWVRCQEYRKSILTKHYMIRKSWTRKAGCSWWVFLLWVACSKPWESWRRWFRSVTERKARNFRPGMLHKICWGLKAGQREQWLGVVLREGNKLCARSRFLSFGEENLSHRARWLERPVRSSRLSS